ncbi:hypothetical protein GQ600_23594 [Phytophthora cactorum]|nr:hypothetical protein GQ600_23594 [Phytophthora cactorum]
MMYSRYPTTLTPVQTGRQPANIRHGESARGSNCGSDGPVALHRPVECLIIEDGQPTRLAPPSSDTTSCYRSASLSCAGTQFPRALEENLRAIAYKRDIWRLELGNNPPAKVDPLKFRLKKGAAAV